MDAMDSGNESEDEPMSMYMLGDIHDGIKSYLRVNMREAGYKIRDCIKQRKTEWKGALLSTGIMDKGLNKVFNTVVNDILQVLPILGESDSEVSYFIP